MIPYAAYKTLHLIGIFLVLLSLGGQIVQSSVSQVAGLSWKKHLRVAHGFGLILVLVAGFGLLARLGLSWPWPLWLLLKILAWLILGFMPSLIRRFADSTRTIWWVILIIAGLAAWLAVFKPWV
jgi:hypothetical protein